MNMDALSTIIALIVANGVAWVTYHAKSEQMKITFSIASGLAWAMVVYSMHGIFAWEIV